MRRYSCAHGNIVRLRAATAVKVYCSQSQSLSSCTVAHTDALGRYVAASWSADDHPQPSKSRELTVRTLDEVPNSEVPGRSLLEVINGRLPEWVREGNNFRQLLPHARVRGVQFGKRLEPDLMRGSRSLRRMMEWKAKRL